MIEEEPPDREYEDDDMRRLKLRQVKEDLEVLAECCRVLPGFRRGVCPACLGARSVQVGGPDEFGNIDYDDCQVCT